MIREEINLDWVKQLNIAIRYIEDHLTGTIEYDELAKMLCCSTYQFQRTVTDIHALKIFADYSSAVSIKLLLFPFSRYIIQTSQFDL